MVVLEVRGALGGPVWGIFAEDCHAEGSGAPVRSGPGANRRDRSRSEVEGRHSGGAEGPSVAVRAAADGAVGASGGRGVSRVGPSAGTAGDGPVADLGKAAKARELDPAFVAARRRHPSVESGINHLQHHGLARVRAKGAEGFARTVALSVLAANLHTLGVLLQRRERRALQLRRDALKNRRRPRAA